MFGDGPRSLLRRFFLQMVERCRLIGARAALLPHLAAARALQFLLNHVR